MTSFRKLYEYHNTSKFNSRKIRAIFFFTIFAVAQVNKKFARGFNGHLVLNLHLVAVCIYGSVNSDVHVITPLRPSETSPRSIGPAAFKIASKNAKCA
ncbi:hypothetical protein EVAR_42519_1 [Eumeta japonica]|uniref:Uncharacterized protein n=1 Tax=Eumeta variegata TaxID=151549 RepID=A0A4C1XE56_EUMVA|nr:hypothetical protein EVAR_42519_1 [Eumeta japonica]